MARPYDDYLKEEINKNRAYSEYVARCVNQLVDKKETTKIKQLKTPNQSIWDRLKIETKISIIIGIAGLLLSFLTLITK